MQRIAGIILAAGESARMGEDKALLPCPATPLSGARPQAGGLSPPEGWAGKTFLEHLLVALKNTPVGLVRVVLGANAAAVQKKIPFRPPEVVVNREWHKGQLSSLIAALDTLPRGMVDAAVVCLVDHPCVSRRLIQTLIEKFQQSGKLIGVPTYRGRRGHPVVFSAALFDDLRAAPLAVGARQVVRQHAGDILEVATEEEGVVLNINDRNAYEKIFPQPPPH